MHDILHTWANDWKVTPYAVLDLLQRLGVGFELPAIPELEGWSEAAVQNRVRMDSARAGTLLWRNNVGAYKDDAGNFVRYGICNDTKQLNETVKSSDLIGIKKRMIVQADVGTFVGQFAAREVKEYGWKYTGTAHEVAQLKFGQIVIANGGDFKFTTGEV